MTLRQPLPLDDYREVDQSVFRQRLTVADIMTPRRSFYCALPNESVRQAFTGVPDVFDALPVIEGDDRDAPQAGFLGIVDRHRADMGGRVRDEMDDAEPIPADLPLIDFIARMRGERLTLVHGRATETVVGLVTIHDLARLPARLVIFALLLEVEETLGAVIERFGGEDSSAWSRFLSPQPKRGRKTSAVDDFNAASRSARDVDGSGDVLSELSLSQKLDLLDGMRGVIPSPRLVIPDLLTRLRNTIAHGKPFAHRGRVGRSVVSIHDVPKAASDIRRFSSDLRGKLGVPK